MAVAKLLFEKAILVMDAVADRREIERGQRVEETRREPPETAIAQRHVVFLEAQRFHIETQLFERRLHFLKNARAVETVGKKSAHQKLQRHIVDALGILAVMHALRGDHALDDDALDGLGSGQPPVPFRSRLRVPREAEFQVILDEGPKTGDRFVDD